MRSASNAQRTTALAFRRRAQGYDTRRANGEDREVDGPGPHMIDGEAVYARSRTFIRATLSDNPDLARARA
jgi:hypothetical protein